LQGGAVLPGTVPAFVSAALGPLALPGPGPESAFSGVWQQPGTAWVLLLKSRKTPVPAASQSAGVFQANAWHFSQEEYSTAFIQPWHGGSVRRPLIQSQKSRQGMSCFTASNALTRPKLCSPVWCLSPATWSPAHLPHVSLWVSAELPANRVGLSQPKLRQLYSSVAMAIPLLSPDWPSG
jgi:hypothetical protein